MSAFNARLRVPGQSRIPLGVEVDVSHEQITLSSGDRKVAEWSLDEIDVDYLSDGFHIKVDGEEVVLSVIESSLFASELGLVARKPAPKIQRPDTPGRGHASSMVENLRQRTKDIAAMLADDSVAPQAAFAEWLGLLKELNTRHARGAMPTPLFHELNTTLLDLIPAPQEVVVS